MGNDANGYLLPSWYVPEQPTLMDLNVVSIIWGFTLATTVFTFSKAIQQSWKSYKRGKLFNAYIIMVWAEWLVCVIISIVSWLFLTPSLSILPGFWLFFGLLCLWVVQIQCILQIIINRVRLLMVDQHKADILKWSVAAFIGLINISVFVIWIPARLQISDRWVHINTYWDRCEKSLFALCDIGLNFFFLYLVRSKLIANGLHKYNKLLRFNILMVCVSLSMDGILIGMMSLPNSAVYIQFHPLTYLVKLHIEMNIADLISKIVKATNQLDEYRTNKHGAPHVSNSAAGTSSSGASKQPSKMSSSFSRTQQQQHRNSNLKRMDSIDLALHGFALPNWGKECGPATSSTTHGVYESGPDLEAGGSEKRDFETTVGEDEGVDIVQQGTQPTTHDVEKNEKSNRSNEKAVGGTC
ncbi:hypothetical protein PFICI_11123 [Pestalotiopsis fici W106-1]|uniref:Uncharacterized protein n=1 Tax=Pestalotiopsis fici (strain W106-1 / CGMCC3.15140) TaxID=1229662 RepID=W3WTZ0_PESFW|nr:uncharacterized protein PFICI_11123 [Pestalotiopsis fici W106-1]ETS77249.1 hypothetical protein PFICI_11123 [Pestalotiopsis fici W106-1]